RRVLRRDQLPGSDALLRPRDHRAKPVVGVGAVAAACGRVCRIVAARLRSIPLGTPPFSRPVPAGTSLFAFPGGLAGREVGPVRAGPVATASVPQAPPRYRPAPARSSPETRQTAG